MSRRNQPGQTPAAAEHYRSEADQYQQVATDPAESPEARAYAQAQYDRNTRLAREAETSGGAR